MTALVETGTWLEKARSLAPLVETWAGAAEQERRLPQPLFEAVRDAGLFRLIKPRAFGGEEARLEEVLGVIEELSRQDGSLGWNVMIGTFSGLLADYLPEEAACVVFGGPGVVAGSFAPNGQAVAAPDGYRVSGRWSFASGCQNADWMVCAALVMSRALNESGPDIRLFFLPVDECELIDTWFTTGMRGTGSHDFSVTDVFVPADRQFPFAWLRSGPPPRPGLGHAQPFYSVASPVMAGVALGIARDAIESFKAMAMTKTPRAGSTTLANQHTVHEKLGLAEATLRSARAYVYETIRAVSDACLTHADGTPDEAAITDLVATSRLAAAYAARCAAEAVDIMFEAGGGTSIYATSRLDRCFRNVHMVTHHIAVAPSNLEMAGQYLLGLGLQVRR